MLRNDVTYPEINEVYNVFPNRQYPSQIIGLDYANAIVNPESFALAAISYDYTVNWAPDAAGNAVDFYSGWATQGWELDSRTCFEKVGWLQLWLASSNYLILNIRMDINIHINENDVCPGGNNCCMINLTPPSMVTGQLYPPFCSHRNNNDMKGHPALLLPCRSNLSSYFPDQAFALGYRTTLLDLHGRLHVPPPQRRGQHDS